MTETNSNFMDNVLDNIIQSYTFNEIDRFKIYKPSGFESFDEHFGGFQYQGVTVLAQRPGTGSNVFMLNSAINKALNRSNLSLFISQDMNMVEILQRSLSKMTQIPMMKMLKPELMTQEEHDIFIKTADSTLPSLSRYVQFKNACGFSEIKKIVKYYNVSPRIETLYIDDNQLISSEDDIHQLVQLATDEHLSIVVNYHLSREIDNREDKRPNYGDLNKIYHVANDVQFIGLYRDEIYNLESNERNILELIRIDNSKQKSLNLKADFSRQTIN